MPGPSCSGEKPFYHRAIMVIQQVVKRCRPRFVVQLENVCGRPVHRRNASRLVQGYNAVWQRLHNGLDVTPPRVQFNGIRLELSRHIVERIDKNRKLILRQHFDTMPEITRRDLARAFGQGLDRRSQPAGDIKRDPHRRED